MTKLITRQIAAVALMVSVSGCATVSDIMEAENGTYLVSVHDWPAQASGTAYKAAQEFCSQKKQRAVVVQSDERALNQGSFGASGSYASGTMVAHGLAQMRFRCVE